MEGNYVKQEFERIAPRLYRRTYKTADGAESTLYYARFVDKLKGKRRLFAVGGDLKTAKNELKVFDARNIRREDFDADKPKLEKKLTEVLTFGEWAKKYPLQQGVKDKRSLNADLGIIRLHLEPYFGEKPLVGITREMLVKYIDARASETLIRNGKAGRMKVKRGTISNELSLLRRILRVAKREGFQASEPSFEGLIVRVRRGGRALSADEQQTVLQLYPKWLARLAEFAKETCLSEGDILRLTPDMIDRKAGVIRPEGGRLKTQATTDSDQEQVAPLTARARAVLDYIAGEKKRGSIVSNTNKLIFTRDDGRAITRSMISRCVKQAWVKAGLKRFVFHSYRNTALTEWARRGIGVDVAMRASGHTSVQMHKRYVDLKAEDIAAAFGTAVENGNINGRQNGSINATGTVSN
jgi:integrase